MFFSLTVVKCEFAKRKSESQKFIVKGEKEKREKKCKRTKMCVRANGKAFAA